MDINVPSSFFIEIQVVLNFPFTTNIAMNSIALSHVVKYVQDMILRQDYGIKVCVCIPWHSVRQYSKGFYQSIYPLPEMYGNTFLLAASPIDYIAKFLEFVNFFLDEKTMPLCSLNVFFLFCVLQSFINIHNSCYIVFHLLLMPRYSLSSLSLSYFLEFYILER